MQTDGHLTRHGARGWLRVLTSLLAAVALAGCSGGVVLEPTEGPVVEPRKIAQAMLPEDPVTAFEPGNPAEIALRASQLFFESAQVVVLASSTEAAAISRASSFAVSLGTPLLLTSPPGQNTSGQDVTEQTDTSAQPGSLNTELLRLGTRAVLTVGEVSLHQLDTTSLVVSPVPDDEGDVEELLGEQFAEVAAPPAEEAVEGLAGLEFGEVYAVGELGTPPESYGSMPNTLPSERIERATVLAGTDVSLLAGVATARAAGADVFASDDPASVTGIVDELAVHPSRPVVGLGDAFAGAQPFERLVSSMQAGQLLPSGSQRIFRTNDQEVRLVTIDAKTALQEKKINNAGDVLGRAKKRAADASLAGGATSVAGVDVPVDGNSASDLAYWANEADEADQYLLLGIGGSGNLLETVRKYENLLERPGVGIRLELGSRESVDAGELNDVTVYLRHLVREEKLTQKLLVLDLGEDTKIAHPDSLAYSTGEVALAISVNDDADERRAALGEEFGDDMNWAMSITKKEQDKDDDEGTSREYPPVRDLLKKGEVDLMTYR